MPDHESLSKDAESKLRLELAQREAELTIINSIQQGLAERKEVQAIYDLVGEKIYDFFNAQVVMISIYDPQSNTVEHRYAIERGERVYASGQYPLGGFRKKIVETRQPLLENWDVGEKAARLGQPTLPGTVTPKSWLGVPMMVGDQVTGILSLQNVEQENAFDESHMRLLQTFASSMSAALENARLFEETQRLLRESQLRTSELQIINSVQEGLAQKLDMASIYELVGEKIRQLYPHTDVSIAIYDRETDLISAPYLFENNRRDTFAPFKVAGKGFIGYLLKNPQTLLINENMAQAVKQYQGVDATGGGIPKSALYVPLAIGETLQGEIILENKQKEHAFTQSDVRILETLANATSVALETARLWEQEHKYLMALEHEFEVGRKIQTGFLPEELPQPGGWEIAAKLLPAREVAGDFYDVFELPNRQIGFVIADVCDKGLGAALFMTLFRSFIRATSNLDGYTRGGSGQADPHTERLKKAITLTNDYIAQTHGKTGMFATIFFGILDAPTGVLTYINGGHLPPVLINPQGAKGYLQRTGPAVGVRLDADYQIKEVHFEPGDTLFAYTDGLTDTANPAGDYFSVRQAIPLFTGIESLNRLLEGLQKQVEEHAQGAEQYDDITLLALRRVKE